MVRGDGSLSPVHAGSTLDGIEKVIGKTGFAAYYGAIYVGRNVAIDPSSGKAVGYGYSGSGNGQNRTIQQGTIDINHQLWKDPRLGALNAMFQYSYLTRTPWYVSPGAPNNAHAHIVFVNLRYTLPGSAANTLDAPR